MLVFSHIFYPFTVGVRQPSNGPFRFNGDVSPVTELVYDWFLPLCERHSNRLLHRRYGDERKHHRLLSLKKCVVLVYGKDGHLYSFLELCGLRSKYRQQYYPGGK